MQSAMEQEVQGSEALLSKDGLLVGPFSEALPANCRAAQDTDIRTYTYIYICIYFCLLIIVCISIKNDMYICVYIYIYIYVYTFAQKSFWGYPPASYVTRSPPLRESPSPLNCKVCLETARAPSKGM